MIQRMRRKVLVIDNDRVASDMIVKTLLPRGLDVSVAASPDRGFEKARELKPDLVFISLFLSDSNGLKISRHIHSEEELKDVPMIMLISYRGELDPKYTSAIGIVDVLVKPLKTEDIIAKTKKVLGEQSVTEGLAGDSGTFSEGETEVIPEEKGVIEVQGPISVSQQEDEPPHAAGLTGEHEQDEAKKEDRRAPEETGEFLKEEDEEEGPAPADKALNACEEGETPSAVTYGEEIFPAEEPRRFFSGRKIMALAAVLAVVLVLGTYSMKKIVSQTRKAAPANVVAEGGAKVTASPDVAVARPVVPAPGEVVPQSKAGAAPDGGYRFTVQVGAFGNEENAALLVDKMKKNGFDAFIEKDPSRPLYRVLVGRFGDPKQASRQARLLREEGLKPVVRTGQG